MPYKVLLNEVNKNPNIWKQRQKLELIDVDNIDQYDDLEDDEKDALDNILSDPKNLSYSQPPKVWQK